MKKVLLLCLCVLILISTVNSFAQISLDILAEV